MRRPEPFFSIITDVFTHDNGTETRIYSITLCRDLDIIQGLSFKQLKRLSRFLRVFIGEEKKGGHR